MSFRNKLLTVIFSSLYGCAAGLADESHDGATGQPTQTRVLVFRSGRALEGEITETNSHYVVVRPVGKVELLKSDIEFVAQNLDEVYRYKLERINDRDPDEHIRLAQWCLVVNLRDRAIEELERCVALAPNSTRVNAMLENLRRVPRPAANSAQPLARQELPTPESTKAPRTYPSFQRELSSAHISAFSVQVQPLLVRSCGTAGCHDATYSGPLVLHGFSRPSQRTTMQNLRSVLAQINPEEPELSPLLVESLRSHGTTQRVPFVKGLNDPAYATLADWVRAVSGKPASKPSSTEPAADLPASLVEQAKAKPHATGKETTQSTLVYSNKPIAQTPARLRAGMTPANSPTDASSSHRTGTRDSGSSTNPPEPHPITGTPIRTPTESQAATTTPDSKPLPTPRLAESKPRTKPAAEEKSTSESYKPVDPFDPNVFNRQFAPR